MWATIATARGISCAAAVGARLTARSQHGLVGNVAHPRTVARAGIAQRLWPCHQSLRFSTAAPKASLKAGPKAGPKGGPKAGTVDIKSVNRQKKRAQKRDGDSAVKTGAPATSSGESGGGGGAQHGSSKSGHAQDGVAAITQDVKGTATSKLNPREGTEKPKATKRHTVKQWDERFNRLR